MPWSSQLLDVSDGANVSGMTDDAASNPIWTPRPDGPAVSCMCIVVTTPGRVDTGRTRVLTRVG